MLVFCRCGVSFNNVYLYCTTERYAYISSDYNCIALYTTKKIFIYHISSIYHKKDNRLSSNVPSIENLRHFMFTISGLITKRCVWSLTCTSVWRSSSYSCGNNLNMSEGFIQGFLGAQYVGIQRRYCQYRQIYIVIFK